LRRRIHTVFVLRVEVEKGLRLRLRARVGCAHVVAVRVVVAVAVAVVVVVGSAGIMICWVEIGGGVVGRRRVCVGSGRQNGGGSIR